MGNEVLFQVGEVLRELGAVEFRQRLIEHASQLISRQGVRELLERNAVSGSSRTSPAVCSTIAKIEGNPSEHSQSYPSSHHCGHQSDWSGDYPLAAPASAHHHPSGVP